LSIFIIFSPLFPTKSSSHVAAASYSAGGLKCVQKTIYTVRNFRGYPPSLQ
jgi:hypothetical protein